LFKAENAYFITPVPSKKELVKIKDIPLAKVMLCPDVGFRFASFFRAQKYFRIHSAYNSGQPLPVTMQRERESA
jgi:hypothetical protein